MISFSRWKKKCTESVESIGDAIKFVVYGTKATDSQPYAFTRMAVLEARAAKRVSVGTTMFLPILFFLFGVTLGMFLEDLIIFSLSLSTLFH